MARKTDSAELKEKANARDQKWRDVNKDHIKAYFASYYAKNKEAISTRRKQKYENDPVYRADCIRRSKERQTKLKKLSHAGN